MKTFKHASYVLTFFFQISFLVNIGNGLNLGSPSLPRKPLQTLTFSWMPDLFLVL